jgi:hypothetical protein
MAALLVIVMDPVNVTNAANTLTFVVADTDDLVLTEKNAAGDRYSYYDVKTFDGKNLKVAYSSNAVLAAQAGCDIATVPFNTLMKSIEHPLTTQGIEKFLKDWESVPKK